MTRVSYLQYTTYLLYRSHEALDCLEICDSAVTTPPAFSGHICLAMSSLALKIEFGGGLELLFDNKRSHRISIPAHVNSSSSAEHGGPKEESGESSGPANVQYLIHWLKENLLRERAELFVEEGTV